MALQKEISVAFIVATKYIAGCISAKVLSSKKNKRKKEVLKPNSRLEQETKRKLEINAHNHCCCCFKIYQQHRVKQ